MIRKADALMLEARNNTLCEADEVIGIRGKHGTACFGAALIFA